MRHQKPFLDTHLRLAAVGGKKGCESQQTLPLAGCHF